MNFLQTLHSRVITGDGAVGTMLYQKGVAPEANFEHLNLVRPSLVTDLHREYAAAGAQLLETNTFGANRQRLGAIGLSRKVREINLQGARLAREVAKETILVAGSVGPLPRPRGEERELSAAETEEIFGEQCAALAEGGVDLLILETFSDLPQLLTAVAAAKRNSLPVVASMAFLEGGRTGGGYSVEEAVRALESAGADVIGANCGAGPLEILRTIEKMAALTDLPLAAFPNSGLPEYVEGRRLYRATPSYFAEMAEKIADAGAALIGGCCGTTPEHVAAMARALDGRVPVPRQRRAELPLVPPAAAEKRPGARFLAQWGKRKVVTVELDPPKGMECTHVLEGARALREAGADAINLAENPLARVRMGNIALGELVQREAGIEAIVHVTCRDRNLLGMQSELMGASLLGIRSILAVTGDPVRVGEVAEATSVYDLNSFGLIKLLADLNSGVNSLGNSIGRGTGFTIGAAFNPNSPRMEVQVARLERKVAQGAAFVQTQPLYDLQRLEEMLSRTAHLQVPILPGILPLVGERNAEYLHNEVPGITIPEEIRRRMRGKEKEEGMREGLAIAREFISAASGRVGGFYLIPPFGRYRMAVELVRYIRELEG